jgi:hypothetical protein
MRLQINKQTVEGVELRYWKIRREKFDLIIDLIKDLPVERIFIGHPKFILDTDKTTSAVVSGINQTVFQRIICTKIKDIDSIKFQAEITKSKNDIMLEGKTYFFAEVGSDKYNWDTSKIWNDLLR